MVAHVQRKRVIGTTMVTHAHMLGSRSSGGPVIRYPQQQKVLRAGHTMYERSMVFGCGGAALLVALSARARSTNPADGGGVQGGAFGLLGVLGVLGMAPACTRTPRFLLPTNKPRLVSYPPPSSANPTH